MNSSPLPSSLELWGGVECTVNRVGDRFFDQLERVGHANRIDDLDRFAALGIQAIRYPVLWERIAPDGLEQADWLWSDQRLSYLDDLGIRPIVGLVHHGSGPHHTHLLDPAFPTKLAQFAAAVAKRYPWLEYYTPVNEPLTTARFSGLYGHWYPHRRDDQSFLTALLHQCKAVVLSMQAIRQINPNAKLVQTEDLGSVFSTPRLRYQAEFENQRRWLSFDLLCGRVDQAHPLWHYIRNAGIEEAELTWFLDRPCPPDIFGINYYLTSDRFLDERLDRYPSQTHGGNGQHTYADVEAVRVCTNGITAPQDRLRSVWERYGGAIAVTEVHLGCTREEQLRWFKEVWDAAQHLRTEGVDVRAVTAWSLLGAYDWNSLLTRNDGYYESGVFDLRPTSGNEATPPFVRSTALAAMLRHLSIGHNYTHPLLQTPGWWQRPQRFLYPPHPASPPNPTASPPPTPQPLLITGATGTLGQAFARICEIRGIPHCLLTRQQMDITNPASVERAIAQWQPWAVVNTAGYVRVDDAEREPHVCLKINADGAAILANACMEQEIGLMTFSSDLVFGGDRDQPYLESDSVSPLNVYGHSKAEAERWVLHHHPCSLVIRTSAFFGPWDEYNFLTIALRTLKAGQAFEAAEDAIVSPTYVPDLVHASLDLLIDGECGLWHLTNPGAITWADLARWTAKLAGLDDAPIRSCSTKTLGLSALRPTYSALGSERGILLPDLDRAIARYLQDCELIR
ncbi:MAG: family 1 glycosylhydrolase [Leptolyngbyaceae cyanobacterium bins.349]|nr:family 1 glycosylhydrolase [Leptolyngbyaceae cyanobacterium bins.349]